MLVNYKGWECEILFGQYGNGNTAIQLIHKEERDVVSVATVNGSKQYPKEIIGIKDWSENEGMVHALQKAGVIEKGLIDIEPTGFVLIEYYKLTDAALAELNEQMGEDPLEK